MVASRRFGLQRIAGNPWTTSCFVALLTGYRNKIWVSLKILVADTTKGPKELQNIQRISELIHNKPKPWRLCRLEGHFYHEGPNGRHLCLVQELLGPTLRTALGFCHYEETDRKYLRPSTVLKISEQLLQTIALLHSVGIAHGGTSTTPAFFSGRLGTSDFVLKQCFVLSLTLGRSKT
jgi:serine/threonine protein kinase